MNPLYTFNPKEVDVSIAGLIPLTGFANNSIIEIAKVVPNFTYKESPFDGSIARTKIKSNTYSIKLHFAQTSPSNNILSLIHNVDIGFGVGQFPLFVKDNSGTSSFYSTNTWIEIVPNLSLSGGIETRTWELRSSFGVISVGGNDTSELNEILGIASSALQLLDPFTSLGV